MTERTYIPTGTGLCGECGRDVGRHDGGHEFEDCDCPDCCEAQEFGEVGACGVANCGKRLHDPIHDVGRVLRCPKEVSDD